MTTIDINFEKRKIGKMTGQFLIDRAIKQCDKDDIKRVLDGHKLQYKEANRLLRSIMQAIMVGDGDDDEVEIEVD